MTSQASINAYVAGAGKPAAVTLADDIHIFHFEVDGNWREAALLFVNRNGHHFRLIRQPDGRFKFCKTWNGMFDTLPWMVEANLCRPDPETLIKLCGSGPQGRSAAFEGLCLLPREATAGRRKAAWRGHLIDVGFNRGEDSFTLYHPYDKSLMRSFAGKPWESREAAAWCAQELAGYALNVPRDASPAAVAEAAAPVEDEKEIEAALAGVWGMF